MYRVLMFYNSKVIFCACIYNIKGIRCAQIRGTLYQLQTQHERRYSASATQKFPFMLQTAIYPSLSNSSVILKSQPCV